MLWLVRQAGHDPRRLQQAVQRAALDRHALIRGERKVVEQREYRGRVSGIQFGVRPQRAEGGRGQTRDAHEMLHQFRFRRIPLKYGNVAEQGHRVIVLKPVILRTDQGGDLRRRDPGDAPAGVRAGCDQVGGDPVVVPAFLRDVVVQVLTQRQRDRVAARRRAPASRRLHERDRGPDHGVHDGQVADVALPRGGRVPDPVGGRLEGREQQAELRTQYRARARHGGHAGLRWLSRVRIA